ncbi:MAG: carboxypeptidase regulatory-like domain-containing protein, partial [Candidatus Sericytochromatia bacterium]|nr:carboxypeptidase regulatory-like domain-containing protein [Candidatus Tanganyikabacteria bacterium]
MRPSIGQRQRPALALGAMVLVLAGLPGCAGVTATGTSQVSSATPLSGTVNRPDLALIANSGPSLVGNVGAGLIGNTGAGLIGNVGAGLAPSNYRTMAFALAQEAAAGAKVVLKDPESGAELTYATTTDAAGKFRFGPGVPDGRYFVEAQFQALGKEFRYRNLVEIRAGQEVSALVCTITTLTTTKVLALTAAKRLDARTISLEALKAAIDELGSVLTPEGVPYMAEDSADRVPALDQLLQDNSAFYKAAQRVSPLLADPFRAWKITFETAGTTPVATASLATASDGRRWSVDFAEHLVLRDKPASQSTEIVAGKAR